MKKYLSALAILAITGISSISQALDFSAHGYYRLRMEDDYNLDLQSNNNVQQGNQGNNNRIGNIFYGIQRFRLEPNLKVNDNISFHATIDFLDDIGFGSNQTRYLSVYSPLTGQINLPGGNGAFGVTGGAAGDITAGDDYGGNINFRRFYVDLLTPIGKFRLGRQASNWGLGIFQNDGNDWDSLFGDTFDRFLYIGKVDITDNSSLALATLIDFVYQNQGPPAVTLLGANPTSCQPAGSAPNNNGANCVQNSAGISSLHDAYQFTEALVYQRPNFEVGTYAGLRFRPGTDGFASTAVDSAGNAVNPTTGQAYGAVDGTTLTYYIDLYGKWKKGPVTTKLEYVYLGGKIAPGLCIPAIQTPAGSTNTILNQPVCLSGQYDLSVNMGALEVEGLHGNEEWKFISGFAQGDSNPVSSTITQFGFRPDYHIGLLMFQSPLGTSPAVQINGNTVMGNRPITSNFVNNAAYVGATYKHKFDISHIVPQAQWIKVGAHIVSAWAPSEVYNFNFSELTGQPGLPRVYNASSWYGIETDLIVEAKFFDHVFWNMTGGILFPGAAFDIKNDDLANASFNPNVMNPIIFDPASTAFAIRSTLLFEF